MRKAYSAVDAVMDLVEFLVCETLEGGTTDVEVGEYLEVDFGGGDRDSRVERGAGLGGGGSALCC
jgi:hypothetical protein